LRLNSYNTMKKRDFLKKSLLVGSGIAAAGFTSAMPGMQTSLSEADNVPTRSFDVIVVGGGSAGVMAAIASARTGAKTALIEWKGYTGGTITEGGTALHSYFNTWRAFDGVAKRQLIKGIPQEIIERLVKIGGSAGHVEMQAHYRYDSVCTSVDTELYKLVSMEMITEAGVDLFLNTMACGAVMDGSKIRGVFVESHAGREYFTAKSFIDSSAYGDLAAHAGARFTEPNDYPVCNSMGVGNIDLKKYYDYLKSNDMVRELAVGSYEGEDNQVVRIGAEDQRLPEVLTRGLKDLSVNTISTTVHKNYLMFIKCGYKLATRSTDRDEITKAELIIRKNQLKAIELFRKYMPGFENAFITRTSPSLTIRRARCIECDYDISNAEITGGVHFPDDVFVYGFHDMAPRFLVKDGGSYGFPYRAACPKGIDNLYTIGMMITSENTAHMSTRNTVSCMAQGQSFGTAAALCAQQNVGIRQLPYATLRKKLEADGVYFES